MVVDDFLLNVAQERGQSANPLRLAIGNNGGGERHNEGHEQDCRTGAEGCNDCIYGRVQNTGQ